MTPQPCPKMTRESQFDPGFYYQVRTEKYRGVAAGGPSSQPLADQNSTWGRKCICRVALFFIPIFSIHFDFILWTYCMSRWRTRAAPGVGKGVRMRQRAVSRDQRKPNLAENQSWFQVSGL